MLGRSGRIPRLEWVDSRVCGHDALVDKAWIRVDEARDLVEVDEMEGVEALVPLDLALEERLPFRNQAFDGLLPVLQ